MTAYYNENDPKAAAWLRELIYWGQIADGEVDTRSIEDVTPNDLRGFTQHHFFAGIGGWSYALRLAGWPDAEPVWTGSCPCQPFSTAGKGKGFADERHLWPAWFHLVSQCRPLQVFGEQVANALPWFDLVSGDLEGEGYAVGAAVIGAHSVGAPHIRQRLYWVAHNNNNGCSAPSRAELHHAEHYAESCSASHVLGDTSAQRQQQHAQCDGESLAWTIASPWADASRSSYIECRDGKRRPIESGTFPLAHGVPGRVGLLRGYGNAIVPQVAAVFIRAYLDSIRRI